MKKPKTHFHPVPTGMGFLFSGSFNASTPLLVVHAGIGGLGEGGLSSQSQKNANYVRDTLFIFFCQPRFSLYFLVDSVELAEFTQKQRAYDMGQ